MFQITILTSKPNRLTLAVKFNIPLSETDKKRIKRLINNSSVKDIVDLLTEEKKISKKEVYNYCLSLKK